ncbi:MAG: hypothetical protein JWN30_2263 [Bacilli bacterium]|nr:hypothetical protein [Bacilli bacterium]
MLNRQLFLDPPAEYRIHPFWFWNGEMKDDEIVVQIAEMSDKGVGGFFLCARQGLQIPYLSEAWFEKVRFAIETAKQYGMHVWLYDEYPYPSGIAGGEVILEHPDAKHCTLEHRMQNAKDGERVVLELPWGRTISAKAVPVDAATGRRRWGESVDVTQYIGNHQAEPIFQKAGLTAYNQKRFFTYRPVKQLNWTAPEGQWEVHVFLEVEIGEFKYYGTYIDPGHREAMQTFIRLTHERFAQAVGEHFGNTVKGMFTDEIGFLGRFPWSPKLLAYFEQKYGYDLRERLSALNQSDVEGAAKIRYEYFQAAHLLIREAYHLQVFDWCEEHRLQYVAEVPSLRMTTQLYGHVTGGDSAHEKLGRSLDWILNEYIPNFRANPRMVSSLSRQLGRERALIECFHSVGWSMTLQDAKWMIDRMAAQGINFFNFHAFFYTLDGITKHDAPPSQFLQNPYWQYFRSLGDYVGRISAVMSQGTAIRKIALLDPTTSFWTLMSNSMHRFGYTGNDPAEKERVAQLKLHWVEIAKALEIHHLDYDHLDPELFELAEIANGCMTIGTASYSVLVLPPISNLESLAWRKIKQFLEQGGKVIGTGMLPYEQIEDDSPQEAELLEVFGLTSSPKSFYWKSGEQAAADSTLTEPWSKGTNSAYFLPLQHDRSIAGTCDRLVELLSELEPPLVRLAVRNQPRSFLMQLRAVNDTYVLFISNQEGSELDVSVILNPRIGSAHGLQKAVFVTELNLETGTAVRLETASSEEGTRIPLYFAPYQSHLLEIDFTESSTVVGTPESAAQVCQIQLATAGDWAIEPFDANVVRFGQFELTVQTPDRFDDHAAQALNSKTGTWVQPKTFIDQCADVAVEQKLPLEFQQLFGTPMRVHVSYPVHCTYKTEFDVEEFPSSCDLFMDSGAIAGDYTIYLNEQPITAADFHPEFIYDHSNQACNVLTYLKMGKNKLRIDVLIQQDWQGVTDPLYLKGDFGVRFDNDQSSILTRLPAAAPLSGGPCTGYPYYAGTLSYKRRITVEHVPKSPAFELAFDGWDPHFHDCAEVLINGQSLGVRPWTPYVWRGNSAVWKEGDNTVEVRVTGTLIGLLEGKYFDYEAHKLVDVNPIYSNN